MGCITSHGNVFPFPLLGIERSSCLAVYEALLQVGSQILPGFICKGGWGFLGGGVVFFVGGLFFF